MKIEPLKILGLTGRKRAGKDLFAKTLIEYDKRFVHTAFADHLKSLCTEVFDVPTYHDHPELKEVPLEKPIVIDDFLGKLSEKTGLYLRAHQMTAKTPRELWQFVGTEYIRSVKSDYWVDKVASDLTHNPGRFVVVTDVRFENEAKRIRALGGTVLKIKRLGYEDAGDTHASEVLDFEPDYVLGVKTNDLSLPIFIARQSVEGLLDFWLSECDYRCLGINPKTTDYYGPGFITQAKLY